MFTELLSNCTCCPRNCGIDRLSGETSLCGIGDEIQVAHWGLHLGEEPPISGTKGSGTIFFEGCNLRCVFCQNYQISQPTHRNPAHILHIDELATAMLSLQVMGAHNINFVSPSHMAWQMAEAIILARKQGLKIPIVYNTNGYDSVDTLKKIRGLIDIYLPDVKYMEDAPAKNYSKAKDYASVIPGVIREMYQQVGCLTQDVATRGLLIRHLVLPGMLSNSKKCLKLIAGISTNIPVSLMSQYSPLHKACDFPEINRTLTKAEYDEIVDYALSIGMENIFIQELQSNDECLPDFNLPAPFSF